MQTDSRLRYEQILASLQEVLQRQFDPGETQQILQLASMLYRSTGAAEIAQRPLDDLCGALLECWQLVQHRSQANPKVRVFNPGYEENGWQSTHTVIAILYEDRPFLIDSIRMEVNRRELLIHTIQNSIMAVRRDDNDRLLELLPSSEAPPDLPRESLIYLEVDRHTDPVELDDLGDTLLEILAEVRLVTGDFLAMREQARQLLEALAGMSKLLSPEDEAEVEGFIRWLVDDHFTFLGVQSYKVSRRGRTQNLNPVAGSGLGLLRSPAEAELCVQIGELPTEARERVEVEDLLAFAKSPARSRVHRPAYSDCIAFRCFDARGRVTFEHRFLGLYTSSVYFQSSTLIPVVRRKVEAVLKHAGLHPGSHDWKELQQILEVYPRDDLFQIGTEELFRTATGILHIHERRQVRLFIRQDPYGRYFSCLVYAPREIYSTEFRVKVEHILCDALGSKRVEFNTLFSESVLARTQYIIHLDDAQVPEIDAAEIERQVIKAGRSWQDELYDALIEAFGEEQGILLANSFRQAFPASYRDDFTPRTAVADIDHMRALSTDQALDMSFYRALERTDEQVNFKLYHFGQPVPLSEVVPIMENLGLKVMDEHPYAIHTPQRQLWIHDFSMVHRGRSDIDLQSVKEIFQDAFAHIWNGAAESDELNRLVLAAALPWRDVAMLRAYAVYMKQIRFPFSQSAIAATLLHHLNIVRDLVKLFRCRFDPKASKPHVQQEKLKQKILGALEEVPNLTDDRILRRFLELVLATVRTNFYQTTPDGRPKPYIALKLLPAMITEMPLPRPMFEIFVYSPRVEGVHLRAGPVARGGLRWSDRYEDFRTEVLGLVKAQQVKNAVIVPVGAKGGFVAKQLHAGWDRDARQLMGIACYREFIRGLLDLTDNRVNGDVHPPPLVVRHDEDDPYLVVAADKGTATFSDIANEVAHQYGFWLGDAFASGGSRGYDHKGIGITARGAWVSVERHFRERGLDTRTTDFTVIGIGDMAGDVFGNGMLLSEHICLVAAFNHSHIFIDPNPAPAASFAERKRLFEQSGGWDAYERGLISAGGGVFTRDSKSITVTAEMKQRFDIRETRLTPGELIHRLLRSPVDLLWNGGIGTYVKSRRETHAEVGDKANDALRVDADQLRCRVIGEGGNLGVTQLARIDFCMQGGACNTDFIDNAGGVDCSDHEVNIKILLDRVVANGDLTQKQRNNLLRTMTDDVADLVLDNNYHQVLGLSLAQSQALEKLGEYRRLISALESSGRLSRALEFIPEDDELLERRAQGSSLTRPELSVLVSYVKAQLKEELATSELPEDPYLAREVETAFPQRLVKKYAESIRNHPLHREIVATQVANHLVNQMGITYVHRLSLSTGAKTPDIAKAYVLTREVFRLTQIWAEVRTLDGQVSADVQLRMMDEVQRLVRRASRWFLRNRRAALDVRHEVETFAPLIELLGRSMGEWLYGSPAQVWKDRYYYYHQAGVPDTLAAAVASAEGLYPALGIIEVSRDTGVDLKQVVEVYCTLGERLDLYWFAHQITELQVDNQWQALARESFRDDLDWQARSIATSVLKRWNGKDALGDSIDGWMHDHALMVTRWLDMLSELKTADRHDYAMFTVAIRELFDLAKDTALTAG